MPVKPPDAGAAEDPLGQHAVGIGLLEASCVGALIAERAKPSGQPRPSLHSHCRTRCLVQAGRLIIQADSCLSVQIAFSTKVDAFAQSKLAARAEGIRTRPKRPPTPPP